MFAPCSSNNRAFSRRDADRFRTMEMDACDDAPDSVLLALKYIT